MNVKFISVNTRFGRGCSTCTERDTSSIGEEHVINGQTYVKGQTYEVDQETGAYLILTGLFREV